MRYIIIILLFGMPWVTPLYQKGLQDRKTDNENVMNNNENVMNKTDDKNYIQESYTIEGTITKVSIGDTSKTSRVQRLVMHLYLKTLDSSQEELKFYKRPVLESDRQLRVGQRVSITARKNELSGASSIVHIEPLD